jgi:tetratricopeptide (TPR) repeat protein
MGKRILISALMIFVIIGLLLACYNSPEVKAPAKTVVIYVMIYPKELAPGELATIIVGISNIGGLADNYTAILNVDGKERERQTVAIEPSENTTITFSLNEYIVGVHEVEIGLVKGNFTIVERMGNNTANLDKYTSNLDRAIELNPSDADAYIRRGDAYYQRREYTNAQTYFTKAINLNPKCDLAYLAYLDLGLMHFAELQYHLAIADFNAAIELNPDCGQAYYGLGRIYLMLHNSGKAIDNLSKAESLGIWVDWREQ